MTRWISLILCAAILYFVFSPQAPTSFPEVIASPLRPQPEWTISKPTASEEKKIRGILSQKFTLLGEGEQAFAFESEDGKYVLKFFKMGKLMPVFSDKLCPHFAQKKMRKLDRVFSGYKEAYDEFREETGLIWIHLAKTDNLHQKISVFDQSGKEHLIDADLAEFVVQEKAELIFQRLSRLYKEGKTAEAERTIASFYDYIQNRTDRGFMDRDKAVAYNYGFVGNRPVQIDLGSFHKRRNTREHKTEKQLQHIQQVVEKWKSEHGSGI